MQALHVTKVCLMAAALALSSCGDKGKREVKEVKTQVQSAFGNKDFSRVLTLSQKGLALARESMGDKAPDTLYFVQGISEANLQMRNVRGAIPALKNELAMRAAAGQPEAKLQARRTLLIKMAEEAGDTMTAADQAVIVSRGVGMRAGMEPQPVYQMAAYYPPQPYQQKIEGFVEIGFGLDSKGSVVGARVLKSDPPGVFDDAALEAFRKWRYTPILDSRGQPTSGSGFKYKMDFVLK